MPRQLINGGEWDFKKGRFYKTELGKIKLNEITSIQQIQMPQTFALNFSSYFSSYFSTPN